MCTFSRPLGLAALLAKCFGIVNGLRVSPFFKASIQVGITLAFFSWPALLLLAPSRGTEGAGASGSMFSEMRSWRVLSDIGARVSFVPGFLRRSSGDLSWCFGPMPMLLPARTTGTTTAFSRATG